MTRSTLLAAVLAALAPAPARGQDAPEVARLIERLEADEIAARDEASAALLKLGKPALPALENALRSATSPEVRGRIEEILGHLKVPAGGGAPFDGLKLELQADAKEVKPGDTVPFTLAVWNVTGGAKLLYLGSTTSGPGFESGRVMELLGAGADAPALTRWHVGFCGTGARQIYTSIPPYGSRAFRTSATYHAAAPPGDAMRRLQPGAHYTFGGRQWLSAAAPAGATHRFRVRYTVATPTDPDPDGVQWVGERLPAAAWSGALVSNEIEVKVREGP